MIEITNSWLNITITQDKRENKREKTYKILHTTKYTHWPYKLVVLTVEPVI